VIGSRASRCLPQNLSGLSLDLGLDLDLGIDVDLDRDLDGRGSHSLLLPTAENMMATHVPLGDN